MIMGEAGGCIAVAVPIHRFVAWFHVNLEIYSICPVRSPSWRLAETITW